MFWLPIHVSCLKLFHSFVFSRFVLQNNFPVTWPTTKRQHIFSLFQTDSIIGKRLCQRLPTSTMAAPDICNLRCVEYIFAYIDGIEGVDLLPVAQIENVEEKNREAKVNMPPVWFPVCNQMTSFPLKLNCCLHPYFSNYYANSNAPMKIAFHRRFTALSLIQSIHQIK